VCTRAGTLQPRKEQYLESYAVFHQCKHFRRFEQTAQTSKPKSVSQSLFSVNLRISSESGCDWLLGSFFGYDTFCFRPLIIIQCKVMAMLTKDCSLIARYRDLELILSFALVVLWTVRTHSRHFHGNSLMPLRHPRFKFLKLMCPHSPSNHHAPNVAKVFPANQSAIVTFGQHTFRIPSTVPSRAVLGGLGVTSTSPSTGPRSTRTMVPLLDGSKAKYMMQTSSWDWSSVVFAPLSSWWDLH